MSTIYYFCTFGLILINIAGVTILFSRWFQSFALARSSGLVILGLMGFFTEHFFGLGQINAIWLLSTPVSLFLIYKQIQSPRAIQFRNAETVFVLAVLYALAWRWYFPSIYPTSEHITDLYFIGNYMNGDQLPPLDHWFPPRRFDFYYGFQHYMAGLMARVFSLSAGLTYNIAFVLLMSLSVTLAWDFTGCFLNNSWKRGLIVITLVLGGTGATIFANLGYHLQSNNLRTEIHNTNESMIASARFIGSKDQLLNTVIGQLLFPKSEGSKPQVLPLEDFGYQYFVGDYHPPLGGYLLLFLSLLCIASLEFSDRQHSCDRFSSRSDALHQTLLTFTVPVMIATNTWTFPLQAVLVAGWICWRYAQHKTLNWSALLAGGIIGLLLIYPFLSKFTSHSAATPIQWVTTDLHTPIRQFLAMHWALLLFASMACLLKQYNRLGLCFTLIFLGLLTVSELIFVDDPSAEHFQRTNTVMKWWGWIWTGALLSLSTLVLSSSFRWHRIVVIGTLLIINVYAINIYRYWSVAAKHNAGQLSGDAVYSGNPVTREMLNFLNTAPYGVVLENCYGNAYTDSGIYAAFSAKPTVMGWPEHLVTWHGKSQRVWRLKDDIQQFYGGVLPNPINWLMSHQVRYIVWNHKDSNQSDAWQTINQAISAQYHWLSFQQQHSRPKGLWVYRKE
ncbi:MAG: hypothetical protein K0U68_01070 [Gammaproteobacteria bacterium]|nr:hypothetical protein [Gammaproteobacteria bacterium]